MTNITLLSKLQKTAPAEAGAECSFVNKLMPDHPREPELQRYDGPVTRRTCGTCGCSNGCSQPSQSAPLLA